MISQYFQSIFESSSSGDFERIQQLLPRKISVEMNQSLVLIPSDSEIKDVVFSINGSKAPGPDRFSAKFYQAYWHIVGTDVTKDIREFFTTGTLHRQQNETHVRLIQKVSGARKVAEY